MKTSPNSAASPWMPSKYPDASHPYHRAGYQPPIPSGADGGKRARLGGGVLRYGGLEPVSFEYCTAMHVAAYYGHWPVIRQLMEGRSQCDPCQLFAARNSQVGSLLSVASIDNMAI